MSFPEEDGAGGEEGGDRVGNPLPQRVQVRAVPEPRQSPRAHTKADGRGRMKGRLILFCHLLGFVHGKTGALGGNGNLPA